MNNKESLWSKIPNKTTLKAMEDLEKGKNVKKFDTAEELFEDCRKASRK